MSSCWNSRRNDGTAMATRISTGISVQATSISVLWVVLEGTGLALALNFTTTMTKSASTNSVISVMSTSSKLWNLMMFSITGVAASCSVISHGCGLRRKSRPAGCERHARYRQPQQPPANLATRHLHAARAPLNKSPKHSRRMAGNAARSALTNGLPEVLLEVHLQKYLQQHCYGTSGQIVRTRRNPASQTIILRLSQCSSGAQSHASPAIRRMSDFPGKSAKTRRFATASPLDSPDCRM